MDDSSIPVLLHLAHIACITDILRDGVQTQNLDVELVMLLPDVGKSNKRFCYSKTITSDEIVSLWKKF